MIPTIEPKNAAVTEKIGNYYGIVVESSRKAPWASYISDDHFEKGRSIGALATTTSPLLKDEGQIDYIIRDATHAAYSGTLEHIASDFLHPFDKRKRTIESLALITQIAAIYDEEYNVILTAVQLTRRALTFADYSTKVDARSPRLPTLLVSRLLAVFEL